MHVRSNRNRVLAFCTGLMLSAGLVFAGLETGTYISDLVSTNPVSSDLASTSDDHLRLIKSTVKATFPNVTGAVTLTHTQLNEVARLSATNAFTGANSYSAAQSYTVVGTNAAPNIDLASTLPVMSWSETDAPADEGNWFMYSDGGQFTCQVTNDAHSASGFWCTIARTGTTIDTVNFLGTTLSFNSVNLTPVSSTFTMTYTGFTAIITAGCRYDKIGATVVLTCEGATGTSNQLFFGFSGIPAAIRPATARQCTGGLVGNSGAGVVGDISMHLSTDGTGSFMRGGSENAFVNSGTKQIGVSGVTRYTCTYSVS